MIKTVAKPLHILLDIVVAVFSLYLALEFRFNYPIIFRDVLDFDPSIPQIIIILSCIPFYIIAVYSLGIYDPDFKRNVLTMAIKHTLPAMALFFLILAFSFFFQVKNMPRSIVVTYLVINYLCSALFKVFVTWLNSRKWRTLIVGSSPRIPGLREKLATQKDINLDIVDVIERSRERDLDTIVRDNGIDMILVVADEVEEKERILQSLQYSTYQGTRVYMIPSSYEVLLAAPRYMRFCDVPFLRINTTNQSLFVVKRFFDFIFSLVLVIILSPLFCASWIAIKLTSKGPAIFKQERIGRGMKPFVVYKFRSMYVNPAEATRKVVPGKDPRLTPVGGFIRHARLDELPQIFNILRGDMSFIGPRPLVQHEVEEGLMEDSWYRERFSILPGITGLAQVHGDYYTIHSDKIKYDLWYVFHYSLILDIQIVIRTLKTIILRKGS